MGKGGNSKKEAGQARKAAAADAKKAVEQDKKNKVEDEKWAKGGKDDSKRYAPHTTPSFIFAH